MHVARDALGIDPDRISGVSGGALSGTAFLAHDGERLLELMCDAFDGEDWNISLDDMDENHGRTPHQRVYDTVVADFLTDENQRAVAEGAQFQVLLGHPPTDRAAALTGTAMTAAYEAELHLKSTPHFNWAKTIGMTTSTVDANAAARKGRLAALITAAATIPPVFRTVIDGGMADMAPMPDPDDGATLILLTRAYRNLPEIEGRTYVAPSDDTPVDKIDFTDPEKLRQTWALGERDSDRGQGGG